MSTYERQAHDRAAQLSRKHDDEYYVMRDGCRLDWEPGAFYVVSGSRFDAAIAEVESCYVVDAYVDGEQLPSFD